MGSTVGVLREISPIEHSEHDLQLLREIFVLLTRSERAKQVRLRSLVELVESMGHIRDSPFDLFVIEEEHDLDREFVSFEQYLTLVPMLTTEYKELKRSLDSQLSFYGKGVEEEEFGGGIYGGGDGDSSGFGGPSVSTKGGSNRGIVTNPIYDSPKFPMYVMEGKDLLKFLQSHHQLPNYEEMLAEKRLYEVVEIDTYPGQYLLYETMADRSRGPALVNPLFREPLSPQQQSDLINPAAPGPIVKALSSGNGLNAIDESSHSSRMDKDGVHTKSRTNLSNEVEAESRAITNAVDGFTMGIANQSSERFSGITSPANSQRSSAVGSQAPTSSTAPVTVNPTDPLTSIAKELIHHREHIVSISHQWTRPNQQHPDSIDHAKAKALQTILPDLIKKASGTGVAFGEFEGEEAHHMRGPCFVWMDFFSTPQSPSSSQLASSPSKTSHDQSNHTRRTSKPPLPHELAVMSLPTYFLYSGRTVILVSKFDDFFSSTTKDKTGHGGKGYLSRGFCILELLSSKLPRRDLDNKWFIPGVTVHCPAHIPHVPSVNSTTSSAFFQLANTSGKGSGLVPINGPQQSSSAINSISSSFLAGIMSPRMAIATATCSGHSAGYGKVSLYSISDLQYYQPPLPSTCVSSPSSSTDVHTIPPSDYDLQWSDFIHNINPNPLTWQFTNPQDRLLLHGIFINYLDSFQAFYDNFLSKMNTCITWKDVCYSIREELLPQTFGLEKLYTYASHSSSHGGAGSVGSSSTSGKYHHSHHHQGHNQAVNSDAAALLSPRMVSVVLDGQVIPMNYPSTPKAWVEKILPISFIESLRKALDDLNAAQAAKQKHLYI